MTIRLMAAPPDTCCSTWMQDEQTVTTPKSSFQATAQHAGDEEWEANQG
jgi:hypothetical protein